jgi:uncharacterized membrane protein
MLTYADKQQVLTLTHIYFSAGISIIYVQVLKYVFHMTHSKTAAKRTTREW